MYESEKHKAKVLGSKRKILDAAKIEFAEHGLAGARVDRIAAQSGVNKAMLYYHFKSKEELYRELIRRHIVSFSSRVMEQAATENELENILRILIDSYYNFFSHDNSFIVPIFLHEMASGGGHFGEIFEQSLSKQGLIGKLVDLLEKGKAEGRFREIGSRQALISFIGMNLFYLLTSPMVNKIWGITNELEFREQRKQVVIDLFLHGIEAR